LDAGEAQYLTGGGEGSTLKSGKRKEIEGQDI
jgi:hypothetical protein